MVKQIHLIHHILRGERERERESYQYLKENKKSREFQLYARKY